jgi:stage III sporulation protein AF
MATLSLWVREILIVVLIGWLLEAFLPSAQFQRYVRLVVGLLVVVAVIGPALSWLRTRPVLQLGTSTTPFLTPSAPTRAEEADVLRLYSQDLARTARAMALAVPGVATARASIRLAAGGAVSEVVVMVAGKGGGGPPADTVTAVRREVATALGLPPARVLVVRP